MLLPVYRIRSLFIIINSDVGGRLFCSGTICYYNGSRILYYDEAHNVDSFLRSMERDPVYIDGLSFCCGETLLSRTSRNSSALNLIVVELCDSGRPSPVHSRVTSLLTSINSTDSQGLAMDSFTDWTDSECASEYDSGFVEHSSGCTALIISTCLKNRPSLR